MEEGKVGNMKRDYDKDPIVIENNFTSFVFGITFWLMFNGLIVYLVFFGDAIDWSQDKDWFLILKDEMAKSARFGGVVIGLIVTNIFAFRSLYKNLKNPRKIIFTNKYIKSDRSFNDLKYLKLEDIKEIKKSFFPLLGTGFENKGLGYIFGTFVAISFVLISGILLCFLSVFIHRNFTLNCYVVIFSKMDNRVINIPIYKTSYFQTIKKYLLDTVDMNIDKAQINFQLANTKEKTMPDDNSTQDTA